MSSPNDPSSAMDFESAREPAAIASDAARNAASAGAATSSMRPGARSPRTHRPGGHRSAPSRADPPRRSAPMGRRAWRSQVPAGSRPGRYLGPAGQFEPHARHQAHQHDSQRHESSLLESTRGRLVAIHPPLADAPGTIARQEQGSASRVPIMRIAGRGGRRGRRIGGPGSYPLLLEEQDHQQQDHPELERRAGRQAIERSTRRNLATLRVARL